MALEALLLGALAALLALAVARRHAQLRRGREAVAVRASEWVNYAEHLARWTGGSEQSGEGAMDDAERSSAGQASSAEQATAEQPGALTAADVGGRVSGILSAAEETAEEIRAEAEAAARLIREAADSYAEQRRREAEQEVNRMLTHAEREARELREAGETMARQVEVEAHARATELEQYSDGLETYIRGVVSSLLETSSRLESVIAATDESEQETLLEALDVERRTTPP